LKLLLIYGDPRIDTFGGVEEHNRNLIEYLSSNENVNLKILTYGENEELNNKTHILRRLTNKLWIYPFIIIYDVYRLMREIKRINPDIIHFQSTHPLYCLGAILAQRNYATVITVHGIMAVEMKFHNERSFLLKFFSKFSEKIALSRIKNIIVVAPEIEEIIKKITDSNTYIIPNGVKLDNIPKINPIKLYGENNILFIGNLVCRKGVHYLIEACSKINNSITNFRLFIVGSGVNEDYFKCMVEKYGLKNKVEFVGFIEGNKKYSYLKAVDLMVLPSMWESLPIVVLEAMACGKPVIASNVGGVAFLVRDGVNGFLVNPGDVDDLAKKMYLLLNDSQLQLEMSRESLRMVKNFEWSKIVDRTVNVYKEIIKAREIA
jgi:glycosyltransferase involved in cell wall biosynthesis